MMQAKKPKLSSVANRAIESSRDFEGLGPARFALAGRSDIMAEVQLVETYPTRVRLLADVANLRDEKAIRWFWGRWADRIRPESTEDLIEIRGQLRAIWREPLCLETDNILDEWSSWVPSHEQLKAIQRAGWLYSRRRKVPRETRPQDLASFRCSIQAGKLVPDFRALRPMLIQGVFEHWPLLRFCANPSCAAPYFVAKRRDQTVCDAATVKRKVNGNTP